jgi:chromosome segregation ATPase
MRRLVSLVFGLWFLQVNATSGPPTPSSGSSSQGTSDTKIVEGASLSAAGLKRIRDNLGIIEQNIKETKENLTATAKNVKTIEQELADLTGIEKEHFDLKQKYLDYIAEAQRQIAKNAQDVQKIDKQVKELKGNSNDPGRQEVIAKATEDKTTRLKWREDADQKVKRVNELLVGLQDNLGQIQARRNALREQIQSWTEREKQFHQLLEGYQLRKGQLEKIAKK